MYIHICVKQKYKVTYELTKGSNKVTRKKKKRKTGIDGNGRKRKKVQKKHKKIRNKERIAKKKWHLTTVSDTEQKSYSQYGTKIVRFFFFLTVYNTCFLFRISVLDLTPDRSVFLRPESVVINLAEKC